MHKIDHEQGSPEWLNWRKGLLTATDAAMLLGLSPYVTPYQGWQRKLGLIEEQKTNAAMERGHRDEPIARDLFINEYGINMTPCCIESDLYNFIGSSLDGISDCGEYILEVKSQRPVSIIPEFHMTQIQHQMLSCDGKVKKAFYVSHWNGVNTTFEVEPDHEWMKMYLPKAKEFWKSVIFHDSPPLTYNDYKDMSGIENWNSYATEYRKACEQIKKLETVKEIYREELVKMCGEDSCLGSGIKVLKKSTKGRIDYDSIPELIGINIEKYRKPPMFSWTIMLDKK